MPGDTGEQLDVGIPDAAPETVPDLPLDFGQTDLPDLLDPGCEPGTGCFMDPCVGNSQCNSGWCLEHIGDGVCSINCQEECPDGWECKPVGGSDPDLVFACVSLFANLCKPCATSADCTSDGGANNVCVDYGPQGAFCGGSCQDGAVCPDGYSCLETDDVDGMTSMQCMADAGMCECTQKSIATQLWTTCENENEFGICTGKRLCTDAGLSECDAGNALAETCNGEDDDCDGDVDEPTEIDGDYVNLCKDDNPCTKDSCNGPDGCANTPLDGIECADGDPCTVADYCDEGECIGTPVNCDDENPCTDDVCGEAGGCQHIYNNADCNDDNPCTVADECSGGNCVGVAISCDCQSDADCAPLDDGDICNGTLHCDKQKAPYQCAILPGSTIECPKPQGVHAICKKSSCNPVTGACSFVPANGAMACNDANACTIGDQCVNGLCTGGMDTNCNDGNPCTDDSCDPESGCLYTYNTTPCQDANQCTIGDVCQDGACLPGALKQCDDSNVCTDDSCDPATGCQYAPNLALCSDSNKCTEGDHCAAGQCLPGSAVSCNDQNLCTDDTCHPDLGCLNTPNSSPCQDGDACTNGDTCGEGLCQPGKPVNCDDGNVCTDDGCDPQDGCVHTVNNSQCDDNNECTTGDHCAGGVCVGTGSLECDDQNPCTKDICLPGGGCEHQNVSGPCSDNDPCTLNDSCLDGACQGGQAPDCDDKNPCTADGCAQGLCTHDPVEGDCEDANLCTGNDTCQDGVCKPGDPVDCNDDNVCTTDFCLPAMGCQNLDNENPCSDGNACTTGDVCADGECYPGEAVACDDENLCTDDYCNPDTGCVFLPNQEQCNDGNECTTGDVCGNGVCDSAGKLSCSDNLICTVDWCDPDVGCVHDLVTPCCGNGFLEPPEECDDGNNANGDECTSVCQLPGCDDNLKNGNESDVDCGGDCGGCPTDGACGDGPDCQSLVCDAGKCLEATCQDQVKNGSETDKDCGGSCDPCDDGLDCEEDGDCASQYCYDGVCQTPACDDNIWNGSETDKDCGGECDPCDDGFNCVIDEDCTSLVCDGTCQEATCEDTTKNGDETDEDCGGSCDPCADGLGCLEWADCVSGYCHSDSTCKTPACDDGAKNGDETDVDCGGSCGLCSDGGACDTDADCIVDAVCQDGACSVFGSGKDGDLVVTSGTTVINGARGWVQGSAGQATVTIEEATGTLLPGDRVLFHQTTGAGAGVWEEHLVESRNGSTLVLTSPLEATYTTAGVDHAQVVRVQQYDNVTVSGGTLKAPEWNGNSGGILVFVAKGTVSLTGGTVDMNHAGFRGKQHGCTYRCQDGWCGESTLGGPGGITAPGANGMGGGGGQRGQDCAAGGGGGHGTAGGDGADGGGGSCAAPGHQGGTGGATGGDPDTSLLILFGGAGGEGGGDEDGGYPGGGGRGAGIVIIRANEIQLAGGAISANGQTGSHGTQGCGSGSGMGGGGGGAGGALYLAAVNATLGADVIKANGAEGGRCAPSNASAPGGTGGFGRIAVRANNLSGTTAPAFVELAPWE